MIYFSFALYGTNPKYTHGMLANAALIQEYYPAARIFIYIAIDVPENIRNRLNAYPNIVLKELIKVEGCSPFFDRFQAIDEPDCDIMIVRDADSRIHARDRACIDEFLASNKTLHIIRDHYWHQYPIMGGMWAIRKAHLYGTSIKTMISEWSTTHDTTHYNTDQDFLIRYIYRPDDAIIHDRLGRHEPTETHTPFRVPIIDNMFVGQVHLFRNNGTEYTEFQA